MVKVDFKSLDSYRAKQGEFRIVDVPPLSYLMIDGHGDPNTGEYRGAIEALFPVAYALKFASKASLGKDYVVMPLEALWWAQDMQSFTTERDKSRWDWTAMILVPEWTTQPMLKAAMVSVGDKKDPPASLQRVRLERLEEGTCVQTLHIGSYDDETETLTHARRVHPRSRTPDDGQAPRDLPERCTPRRTGQAAHDPAAACHGTCLDWAPA